MGPKIFSQWRAVTGRPPQIKPAAPEPPVLLISKVPVPQEFYHP